MSDGQPYTSHTLAAKASMNEPLRVARRDGDRRRGGIRRGRQDESPARRARGDPDARQPEQLRGHGQWVSVLGFVEDKVVDAFRHGRGVPYAAYNRFHEVMAEESVRRPSRRSMPHYSGSSRSSAEAEKGIKCSTSPAVPVGPSRHWRSDTRTVVSTGTTCPRRPSTWPGSSLSRDLANARYEIRDVAESLGRHRFDLVTGFDAIHDQSKPAQMLADVAAVDQPWDIPDAGHPGSSNVDQNIANPIGAFVYTVSTMHCMSVSLANGGPGLGAAWGKELALKMLADAGFGPVEVKTLPHDIINYYYVTSPRNRPEVQVVPTSIRTGPATSVTGPVLRQNRTLNPFDACVRTVHAA